MASWLKVYFCLLVIETNIDIASLPWDSYFSMLVMCGKIWIHATKYIRREKYLLYESLCYNHGLASIPLSQSVEFALPLLSPRWVGGAA